MSGRKRPKLLLSASSISPMSQPRGPLGELRRRKEETWATFYSILFYSIRLPKFRRARGEDESGLSSFDLLGSDAGSVPPDDLPVDLLPHMDPERTSREQGQ